MKPKSKIMFNDRFLLTDAVIKGHKTMTRRIIRDCTGVRWSPFVKSNLEDNHGYELKPRYNIGDILAVAQSYKDLGYDPKYEINLGIKHSKNSKHIACDVSCTPGWTNKMFTRAELMRHKIRITNVRVERLQDISDEDCMQEGVISWNCQGKKYFGFFDSVKEKFSRHSTPREAFAALIDNISGKGLWESNPFVFVYEFELVKDEQE